MAVNRTKVLEAAQKFLSKGQYDKAIAEYQKLVSEDPRDVRTLLKIGDLHTRRATNPRTPSRSTSKSPNCTHGKASS